MRVAGFVRMFFFHLKILLKKCEMINKIMGKIEKEIYYL